MKESPVTDTDYPYIRAWGRLVGAAANYIDRQIARARYERAPSNAVYRNTNGQWLTTDDILLPDTRAALGLAPLPYRPIDTPQLVHQLQTAIAADGPMNYLYGLDTIEPSPEEARLRLTFSTGYTAELRLTVHRPDSAASGD
jgi:hypothetical protein